MDEEEQRSELLKGSKGRRTAPAAQPQEAESAFSALFGGSRAHSKPLQDESASQDSDAPGRGTLDSLLQTMFACTPRRSYHLEQLPRSYSSCLPAGS